MNRVVIQASRGFLEKGRRPRRSAWSDRSSSVGGLVVSGLLALALLAIPVSGQSAPSPEEAPASLLALPDLSRLEAAVADQIREARRGVEALFLASASPAERAEGLGVLARLFDAYAFDAFAETYYRAALAQEESFRWVYALAYKLQRSGEPADYVEAERLYAKALQLDANSLPAYIHLAEILRETNRLDQAEQVLQLVLGSAPEEPSARALLGQLALDRGQYQRAVELLEGVVQQMPAANRLHYPLALAYRGLGNAEQAARHLELRGEVGVRPPDPWVDELENVKQGERVHILSGRMAYRAGRFAEAAELFQKAVDAQPESAAARVNLGTALSQLGRYNEAIIEFQQALLHDPDNATALFNIGSLLLAGDRPAQAISFLGKAAELSPRDSQISTKLGEALASAGKNEQALDTYRKAIEISFDSEPARLGEATTLVALGRYREAIQSLDDTIDVLGRTVPVVYALIRLLTASPEAELRDGERALDLATKLYEIQPLTGHAALVAEAYAELGRCEEAAEWQQKVIATVERANEEVLPEQRAALARYQEQRPCRAPGDWQKSPPSEP